MFIEVLPAVDTFHEDESYSDATAKLLLTAMQEPCFTIGLIVAESLLAHTIAPSRALQSPTVDLVSAYSTIDEVKTHLNKTQNCTLTSFHNVFQKAEELLLEIGSEHDTIPTL